MVLVLVENVASCFTTSSLSADASLTLPFAARRRPRRVVSGWAVVAVGGEQTLQVAGQVVVMKCSTPVTPFGASEQNWSHSLHRASMSMHAAGAVPSPAGVDVAVDMSMLAVAVGKGTLDAAVLALTAVEDGAVGTAPSPSTALRTAELGLGLGVDAALVGTAGGAATEAEAGSVAADTATHRLRSAFGSRV